MKRSVGFRRHRAASWVLLTVAGPLGVLPSSLATQEQDAKWARAKIADVAWIAGHWEASLNGARLEEFWSNPGGDCMVGMFRWVKDGKVWIYELLTIREEDDTLVFRFRHFSDEMDAWESKMEPLTYYLVSSSDREAVFENPASDSHRRYAFERADAKTLVVRVGAHRDGKLESKEFRYTRQE